MVLDCVYDYTSTLKNPGYRDGRRKTPAEFAVNVVKAGIEPDFCDTVTRRFNNHRLYYLHCQSKEGAVRTEHEMIIDRKSMAVTTTLHFYVNDEFMTGIIHLGQCEYRQEADSAPAK